MHTPSLQEMWKEYCSLPPEEKSKTDLYNYLAKKLNKSRNEVKDQFYAFFFGVNTTPRVSKELVRSETIELPYVDYGAQEKILMAEASTKSKDSK